VLAFACVALLAAGCTPPADQVAIAWGANNPH
jgi:hypothetical protein